MKKLYYGSIILNLVLVLALGAVSWKFGLFSALINRISPQTVNYSENVFYQERTSLFDNLKMPDESIVFIGDSITQRAEWRELFDNPNIVNRGIGSDTTEGVLNRLNSITRSKPNKIFLMVGVNDLSFKKDISETIKNYDSILHTIQVNSPDTEIYVQSILPVNEKIYGKVISNEEVRSLNDQLFNLSNQHNVTYVDLYSEISINGELPDDLTIDGIHLNGEAYLIWRDYIAKFVE